MLLPKVGLSTYLPRDVPTLRTVLFVVFAMGTSTSTVYTFHICADRWHCVWLNFKQFSSYLDVRWHLNSAGERVLHIMCQFYQSVSEYEFEVFLCILQQLHGTTSRKV
jgi:hypothetical protein